MSPLLIKISKDFATIWTTIDPIGNVAIFAGLTASLTRAERQGEGTRRKAKGVPYYSLETPCAASHSHTAVYSGGGLAPRSVNSWRCFDNSFISVVLSSAAYLKSALRFNSSSAST